MRCCNIVSGSVGVRLSHASTTCATRVVSIIAAAIMLWVLIRWRRFIRPRSWHRPPPGYLETTPQHCSTGGKAHDHCLRFSQEWDSIMVPTPGLLHIGGAAYFIWADPPTFG